jgi:hypothetical protein
MTVISLDTITSPFSVLSNMCICIYTAFFGILILVSSHAIRHLLV